MVGALRIRTLDRFEIGYCTDTCVSIPPNAHKVNGSQSFTPTLKLLSIVIGLEVQVGFEPTTFQSRTGCSPTWAYWTHSHPLRPLLFKVVLPTIFLVPPKGLEPLSFGIKPNTLPVRTRRHNGGLGRVRTYDQLLNRQLLFHWATKPYGELGGIWTHEPFGIVLRTIAFNHTSLPVLVSWHLPTI